MKIKFFALLVIVIALLFIVPMYLYRLSTAKASCNFSSINEGMSKNQVFEYLGEPYNKDEFDNGGVYYFGVGNLDAMPATISFANNKVVGKTCPDDHSCKNLDWICIFQSHKP